MFSDLLWSSFYNKRMEKHAESRHVSGVRETLCRILKKILEKESRTIQAQITQVIVVLMMRRFGFLQCFIDHGDRKLQLGRKFGNLSSFRKVIARAEFAGDLHIVGRH